MSCLQAEYESRLFRKSQNPLVFCGILVLLHIIPRIRFYITSEPSVQFYNRFKFKYLFHVNVILFTKNQMQLSLEQNLQDNMN